MQSIFFTADRDRFFFGSRSGVVRVWDAKLGTESKPELYGLLGGTKEVAICDDGLRVASACMFAVWSCMWEMVGVYGNQNAGVYRNRCVYIRIGWCVFANANVTEGSAGREGVLHCARSVCGACAAGMRFSYGSDTKIRTRRREFRRREEAIGNR